MDRLFPDHARMRAQSDPYRSDFHSLKPPTPPDIEDPTSFLRLSFQAIFDHLNELSRKMESLNEKIERLERSQIALGMAISQGHMDGED